MVIDENCLTGEDCRQAVIDVVAEPRDWKSHVSKEEWQQYENELAEIERQEKIRRHNTPNVVYLGEPPAIRDKHLELVQRASFRAYACAKYGGSIWYGDGPPPWER